MVELPGYIEDQPVEACADVAGKLVEPGGGWIEGAWVGTEYTEDVNERAILTGELDVTLLTGDFRFRILRYPSRPPKPPVSPDTITILLEAGRGGIQSVPRDTTAVTVEFAPAGEVPPVSTVIFESDEFD